MVKQQLKREELPDKFNQPNVTDSIIGQIASNPDAHTAENFILIYDYLAPRYRLEFVRLWMKTEHQPSTV